MAGTGSHQIMTIFMSLIKKLESGTMLLTWRWQDIGLLYLSLILLIFGNIVNNNIYSTKNALDFRLGLGLWQYNVAIAYKVIYSILILYLPELSHWCHPALWGQSDIVVEDDTWTILTSITYNTSLILILISVLSEGLFITEMSNLWGHSPDQPIISEHESHQWFMNFAHYY